MIFEEQHIFDFGQFLEKVYFNFKQNYFFPLDTYFYNS
jgi:hypothetical protein